MRTYRDFQPTGFDCKGLALEDRQDWLVHPCGTNRDADCLARSNFAVACRELETLDPEGVNHEVHRFGHWACGWFEIIIVRPDTACALDGEDTEAALADYPVLDDTHYSECEMNEANEAWRECYRVHERIAYIREHRTQFEFRNLADMVGCVRGRYFAGYASDLLA